MFQSTPSARRATHELLCKAAPTRVSIHALRTEGDFRMATKQHSVEWFQSTPSARRATARPRSSHRAGRVSIHALRTEGDAQRVAKMLLEGCFNPRPPHGGRPVTIPLFTALAKFQSTPSARRATWFRQGCRGWRGFNPRPPHGGRLVMCWPPGPYILFQSTPSARRATRSSRRSCSTRAVSIHALRTEGDFF